MEETGVDALGVSIGNVHIMTGEKHRPIWTPCDSVAEKVTVPPGGTWRNQLCA